MKKTIIFLLTFVLLASSALGYSMSRSGPSTISPGEDFTITYNVDDSGLTGNWGVLIEDDISGGCTPDEVRMGFVGVDGPYTKTFTAPSSGTCTFSGNYAFSDAEGVYPETDFQDLTITVSGTTDSECGNEVKETGEQCDGNDLGGKTCTDYGYDYGTLNCDSSCILDTSDCKYDSNGDSGNNGGDTSDCSSDSLTVQIGNTISADSDCSTQRMIGLGVLFFGGLMALSFIMSSINKK